MAGFPPRKSVSPCDLGISMNALWLKPIWRRTPKPYVQRHANPQVLLCGRTRPKRAGAARKCGVPGWGVAPPQHCDACQRLPHPGSARPPAPEGPAPSPGPRGATFGRRAALSSRRREQRVHCVAKRKAATAKKGSVTRKPFGAGSWRCPPAARGCSSGARRQVANGGGRWVSRMRAWA